MYGSAIAMTLGGEGWDNWCMQALRPHAVRRRHNVMQELTHETRRPRWPYLLRRIWGQRLAVRVEWLGERKRAVDARSQGKGDLAWRYTCSVGNFTWSFTFQLWPYCHLPTICACGSPSPTCLSHLSILFHSSPLLPPLHTPLTRPHRVCAPCLRLFLASNTVESGNRATTQPDTYICNSLYSNGTRYLLLRQRRQGIWARLYGGAIRSE